MNKIKAFFDTPQKAVASVVLALAVLVLIGSGVAMSTRAAAQSVAIGEEAATRAAMADAGVSADSAVVKKTKFEMEHGQYVYEIEFIADGVEYEYKINSKTGAVVEKSSEGAGYVTSASDTVMISLDEAEGIALADAGKKASDVTVTQAKLDQDDHTHVYEIEFMDDQQKYEYKLDAYSGEILSREIEVRKNTGDTAADNSGQSSGQGNAADSQSSGQGNAADSQGSGKAKNSDAQDDSASSAFIGIDRAKEIALEHAGLTENEVTFSKAKTDKEHGVTVYEIEFFKDRMEYDYEINAATGEIIEWDKDYDD